MLNSPIRRRRRAPFAPALILGALLVGAGCGDGGVDFGLGGCAGAEAPAFEPTAENTVERAVLGRLTRAGVDFLIAQREAIVGLLLDVDPFGRVAFELPVVDFGASDGLGIGLRDVIASFNIRAASVEMAILPDPDRVRVLIKNTRVSLDQGVVWVSVGGNAACEISNGIAPGTGEQAVLVADFAVDVAFEVDADGLLQTQIEFLPFVIHELDLTLGYNPELEECSDGDSARECEIVCGATERGVEIVGRLIDTLQSDLNDLVEPVVADVLADALSMYNGQPLFMEGSLDPGELVATLVPNLGGEVAADAQPVGFRGGIPPEGLFVQPPLNGGASGAEGVRFDLDIALDAPDHPCVPPVDEPPPFFTGTPPTLDGTGDDGQAYHAGIALSSAVVNRLLWTAYRGGLLCLSIDTDQLEALLGQRISSDTLGIILPGLSNLTGGPQPLLVTLDPAFGARDFPLVELQERGLPGQMPRAGMSLRLPQLGLSFYTRVEERWTRLVQARVTLEIGVEVYPTPDNALALAIDPPVITDLQQTYNELLDDAAIPELLDLVSSLATSALATDPIELQVGLDGIVSMVTGLPFDPRITGLNVQGASRDFLSVLMRLEHIQAGAGATAETSATLVPGSTSTAGVALVQVEAALGAEGEALYQYRVDRGPWRSWRQAPGGLLQVEDPMLKLIGDHAVEIRATDISNYRAVDPTPAQVTISTSALRVGPSPDAPAPTPQASEGGGCALSPAQGGHLWLWGALLALVGLRRRGARRPGAARKGRLIALLAALSLWGCGDERGAPAITCDVSGDCPGGFVCEANLCVAADTCDTSADCCPGSICEGGRCRPDADRCDPAGPDTCGETRRCEGGRCVHLPCNDGGQCPGGGVCVAGHCHQNPPCTTCGDDLACYTHLGECRRAPPSCDMSCAAGELKAVSAPSQYTGAACDLSQAVCECVPAPPLRPTDLGRSASMAVVADQPYFVAYDAQYGDLVFIEGLDDPDLVADQRPIYTYLDGVPEGRPAADPLGPRGGVVEPGPDVGRYASMALDGEGRFHVAYYDSDSRRLMYIQRGVDGQWGSPLVVDADGDVGRYVDLAVDSTGRPHMAYYLAASAQARDTGDVSGVRYAVAESATPARFSVVDVSTSLTPDGVAPPPAGETPKGHGVMPCLALSTSGRPFIGFHDTLADEAWLAVFNANGFEAARLAGEPSAALADDPRFADVATHQLGAHCDLLAFGGGQVGMVMVDDTTQALVYYRGDGAEGIFEAVDQGRGGVRRFVGADAALGVDDEGEPVVVYQDASDLDLLMKVRADGHWSGTPVEVALTGAQGFHITAVVTGQDIIIGALEMALSPGGQTAHTLKVYRRDVPAF